MMKMQARIQVTQQHTLSYAQIQSLNILAMTTAEFAQFCQQEQLENPLLELTDPKDPLDDLLAEQSWLTHQSTSFRQCPCPDEQRILDIPYHDQNELQVFLLSQVNEKQTGADIYRLLRYLISYLDERGFLCIAPEQLATEMRISRQMVLQALQLLQSLEPAGVGARDLTDCLLLQLARTNERTPLMEHILTEHIEDIANARYRVIAQSCGIPVEKVKTCVQRITLLNPHPCTSFARKSSSEYISPDLIARHSPSGWDVEINDQYIGELRISNTYLKLAENAVTQDEREYFSHKIRQARMMLRMIEQRRQTILSVTNAILQQQTEFALSGHAPRPLTQQHIAHSLGIHISTVSRAIRGKYIQLPRAVLPMHMFFQSSAGVHQQADISREDVKQQVRALIIGENPNQPMRDQEIAEQLTYLLNLPISRRVVAKYRAELGIKNVYDRRCS